MTDSESNRVAAASEQPSPWRRRLRLASVAFTVMLLFALAQELRLDKFDDLLARVDRGAWGLAFSAYFALNIVRALRFRVLLRGASAPLRLLVPITLYHNFLVRALPFKLGELSYILLLRSRLRLSVEQGLSSLAGARLLELLIVALVFAWALLSGADQLAEQRDELAASIALAFSLSASSLYFGGSLIRRGLFLCLPPLKRLPPPTARLVDSLAARATRLASELDRLRQPRIFLSALFLSCFTYSASFAANFVLLRALGLELEPAGLIAIISLGMFASALPFTPSGFGVVEVAWRTGLVQFAGWEGADATATAFLLHGFQLAAAGLCGLLGYVAIHFSAPARSPATRKSDILPHR